MIGRLQAVCYFAALCVLLPSAGGLFYLLLVDVDGPATAEAENALIVALGLTVVSLLLVVGAGIPLYRKDARRTAIGSAVCLLLVPLTLYGAELVFRPFVPDWPALALHGVSPEVGRRAWAHTASSAAVGVNGWGQRDRQRSIEPAAGVYRIAFVGDSFLEESSTTPVSLRVEQMMDRPDVEAINLGVSASGPDEYYYRTRNVAIPLGADHCVLCLFSGNDFAPPQRTLESFAGIVAVAPRGSCFSALGLRAVNHLLTNRNRPVLAAWFAAGDLLAAEHRLEQAVSQADDQKMRDILYSLEHNNLGPAQRRNLARRLNDPATSEFFETLRNPDEGLFRSYYLSTALHSAAAGDGAWGPLSIESCWYWTKLTQAVCRERGVGFTVVIIPEAFQVDPRMSEQWRPLADMQNVTRACRVAAERFTQRAEDEGIDVIDLHPALDGVEGAYLNLDGHWSNRGVEIAAEVLTNKLRKSLKSNRKSSLHDQSTIRQSDMDLNVLPANLLPSFLRPVTQPRLNGLAERSRHRVQVRDCQVIN